MPKTKIDESNPECLRCGAPKSDHLLVNYTWQAGDTPMVSLGDVLICPTSVFLPSKKSAGT